MMRENIYQFFETYNFEVRHLLLKYTITVQYIVHTSIQARNRIASPRMKCETSFYSKGEHWTSTYGPR